MRCFPRQMTIGHTFKNRDDFDLEPPYQRKGGIWTRQMRQMLIDSVLGGFDIPKIYIHENPWHNKAKPYAVADGKQRLLTLWSYMNNEFPLHEQFRLFDRTHLPGGTPRGGALFRDLPAEWQERFAGVSLDFVVISTSPQAKVAEDAIRLIFARLNAGAAMRPGEVANARFGSLADLARTISEHKFIADRISFSTKRNEDKLLAQNLVAMEVEQHRVGTLYCERKPDSIKSLMESRDLAHQELASVIMQPLVQRLDSLCDYFHTRDPLLKKRTLIEAYVCLIDWAEKRSGGGNPGDLRAFIADFERRRNLDPTDFDGDAGKYKALVDSGTNAAENLRNRAAILSKWLVDYEQA